MVTRMKSIIALCLALIAISAIVAWLCLKIASLD
jgi:hypothetical protein